MLGANPFVRALLDGSVLVVVVRIGRTARTFHFPLKTTHLLGILLRSRDVDLGDRTVRMNASHGPKTRINPNAFLFRSGNSSGRRDAVQDEMDVEHLLPTNLFPNKSAIPDPPRFGGILGIGQSLLYIAILRVNDRLVEFLPVANGSLLMLPNHSGGVVFFREANAIPGFVRENGDGLSYGRANPRKSDTDRRL